MKKSIKLIAILLVVLAVSCKKDDDNSKDETGDATCYTCTDCQGQYGHLIDGQKCVDGFDNRKDWLDMKATWEGVETQCNCEFD